jgi:DNA-directed RNA polymerase specialized sigma24 family protein
VHNINSPGGQQDFHRRLRAIREDPRIKRFASRYAADPLLAEDALQEAYWAVGRARDPHRIENLGAYFCTVLIREVYRLRGQLGTTLVDDFESLVETRTVTVCGPAPAPVDEALIMRLMAETWIERFYARRGCLRATVPARSNAPERYRDLIVAVAEQVLRDAINGEASPADFTEALRAAHPQWFAQPDCAANTCHQRLRRARVDVQELLKTIVNRDELLA